MKVTHDNINTFLYTPGKYFVIPDFQRPYSWDKTNVVSFIEDLESVMHRDKNHYFGSIVYINEGNNSTIIDGQQRATTVLLMLTAIFHIATEQSLKEFAEEIKEKYLYNRHDYSEHKSRIKLRTVTTDNAIFENIFNQTEFAENSKDSKLYQSYNIFYNYFKYKNNDYLRKYISALEHFEVVTIALDRNDDNPQMIFESINSTGKPLTDGDKIRNFALMLNNREARNIVLRNYWGQIETQLTDINEDYISDFFKYYLTSLLQKEVKIEQVYPEFKKLFYRSIGEDQDNIAKLEAFYGEVLSYLEHYSFLKFNVDDNYKIFSDKGFRLNFLRIESIYPFLMRILNECKEERIEKKEALKIFDLVEGYLARRIICNIPTSGTNNYFSIMHRDITNYLSEYPDEKYSNVLAYILSNKSGTLRLPKETEVESAIKNNPMYSQRNYYINFILSSVDDQSKESKLLKQIENGDVELSIEHIMPQTLNRKWIEDLGDEYEQIHEQYLHTLPNLTLTGYNSKYSNNDFETKKTIEHGFNDSPLLINQFVKGFDKWDLSAFEKREKWWMKQINKIWPIPESTFMPVSQETEFNLYDDKDLTGSGVSAVVIRGEKIDCASWADVIDNVLKNFFGLDDKLYDYVTSDDFLHRYINADQNALRKASPIEGTPYYYEKNTNTNIKRDIVIGLAEYLELDKTELKVILTNKQ